MKRTSKILVSMLLLVTMFANLLPLAVFTAGAADSDFYYRKVNTMTPGKEYLVVSTGAAGTGYALKPADGANSANKTATTSKAVTINADGTINGSALTESLEWEFMQASPSYSIEGVYGGGLSDMRFMLQNKATGAYLWNPAYETDVTNIGTVITPLQDNYNGSTFASFDYAPSVAVGSEGDGILSSVNASSPAYTEASGLQLTSKGDVQFVVNFARTPLDGNTWRYVQYTYHANTGGISSPVAAYFPRVGSNVFDGATRYAFGISNQRWTSVTNDLYTSSPANGWKGVINQLRIDPMDGSDDGKNFHIDSVSLGKTVRGIQILANYRQDVTTRTSSSFGGQYPSVEYPFVLFSVVDNGDNFSLRFYGDSSNSGGFYLKAPTSDGASFTYSGAASSVYLYEKTYGASEYRWALVDSFEDGGEYVIAYVNGNTGYAITETLGTGIPGATAITVANNAITSEVTPQMTYSAYTASSSSTYGKMFWLSSDYTRAFLQSCGNVGCGYGIAVPKGGAYTGNLATTLLYTWNYNSAAKLLNASFVDKACNVPGTVSIDFNGTHFAPTSASEGKMCIFKKTYHVHTETPSATVVTPPTCDVDGYTTSVCSECGLSYTFNAVPALGHDLKKVQIAGDNTAHAIDCTRCDYYSTEAHSYGMASYIDDTNHSSICSECGYVFTENHHHAQVYVPSESCTEAGYTKHYCSVEGCTYEKIVVDTETSAHLMDGGRITKEPTCTATGEMTYTCTRCAVTEVVTLGAHGHVYSDTGHCLFGCGSTSTPIQSSAEYIYKYVDMPVAGRDYVIANTNHSGNAYIATYTPDGSPTDFGLLSVPSVVTSDAYGKYITGRYAGPATLWTAEKSGDKFLFKNKNNNEYLWSKNVTSTTSAVDDEWIQLNVGSGALASDSYFTVKPAIAAGENQGQVINSGIGTQFIASNGYYVGFDDVVSTAGITIPGEKVLRFYNFSGGDAGIYAPVGGYLTPSGTGLFAGAEGFVGLSDDLVFDFDFALESADSGICVSRPSIHGGHYGTSVQIFNNYIVVTQEQNTTAVEKLVGYAKLEGFTHGADVWHHLRFVSDPNTMTTVFYIDGEQVLSVENFTFKAPSDGDNIDSCKLLVFMSWISADAKGLGMTEEEFKNHPIYLENVSKHPIGSNGLIQRFIYGQGDNAQSFVDNVNATSSTLQVYDDFDGNTNMYYVQRTGVVHDITGGISTNVGAPVANNVFVADDDTSNRVYLYEKQFKYTFNYYYDDVLDSSLTYTNYAAAGSSVTAPAKPKDYYELNTTKTPTMTVTVSDTGENVVNVYYDRPNVDYTIEYYYDNVIDPERTVTGSVKAGQTVTAEYKPKDNYSFESVTPSLTITAVKGGNNVIKLYYTRNQVSYTVYHNFEGENTPRYTDTGSASVGSSYTAILKNEAGYVFDNAAPANYTITISATSSQNVINIYYKRAYTAVNDAYAMSFASTKFVAEKLTGNDEEAIDGNYRVEITGISATEVDTGFAYPASQFDTTSATSNGVNVAISDGNIIATTYVSCYIETFYVEYTVTVGNNVFFVYSALTLVPATTIYFEDNAAADTTDGLFITYSNGQYTDSSSLAWATAGSGDPIAALYNDIYGYSDSYNNADNAMYSSGSSHKIVIEDKSVSREANASFTFTGAGFDILSHCNNFTGIIFVDVLDAEGNTVRNYFVNTYLGYNYDAVNGWVEAANGDATYQVPVIRINDLTYGTYTVVVTPVYDRAVETWKETNGVTGDTEFYLDGIRVYNPMSDSDADTVYSAVGEAYAYVTEVGDILMNLDADNWYDSNNFGAMYIENNNGVASAETYKQYGPNNEIYLAQGNSVNFYITAPAQPVKVYVSASVIASGDGQATLTVNDAAGINIVSGIDMYYDISSSITWNGATSGIISIKNTGAKVLALSTIKILCDSAFASGSVEFRSYSAPEMISFASQFSNDDTIYRTSILGDINGDGRFTASDLLLLKRLISGDISLTKSQEAAADVNGDGRWATSIDLRLMKEILSGQ